MMPICCGSSKGVWSGIALIEDLLSSLLELQCYQVVREEDVGGIPS